MACIVTSNHSWISRTIFYRWRRRYRRSGLAGLHDGYRGPRNHPYTTPPHVVALIDLDEGVRMMSNLVKDEPGYPSIDPDDVSIGMKVRVVFHDVTDEITLPKFVAA